MRKKRNHKLNISITWIAASVGVLIMMAVLIFIYLKAQMNVSSVGGDGLENAQETKEEGLIAYWNFDEGEGSILGDSSGSGINGEIHGTAWVRGISGKALEFDGVDDFVEINARGLDVVGELEYGTIAFWFKFRDVDPTEILPMLYFGEANDKKTTDNLIIEIGHFGHGFSPNKRLYYALYNDGYEPALCFDSNQNLREDAWYHLAIINGPSGNTGYLNGVELDYRHYNFSDSADARFFSSLSHEEIFRLGYGWFGIDQKIHFFKGALDDFRIYDRALAAEEIMRLAN